MKDHKRVSTAAKTQVNKSMKSPKNKKSEKKKSVYATVKR